MDTMYRIWVLMTETRFWSDQLVMWIYRAEAQEIRSFTFQLVDKTWVKI